MALVKINSTGYQYRDVDGSIFFKENSEHNALFTFVSSDLSKLPELLDSYFNKIIDTCTFDLKDYTPGFDDSSEIEELLHPSHPYFEHESTETFIHAVGEYFNSLLIQATYNAKDQSFAPIYDEHWYVNRFNALTHDYVWDEEDYAARFYSQYKSHISWEQLLPPLPARGFYSILSIQEMVQRLLFWLLDASAPYINSLTVPQRMHLYGNIYSNIDDEPAIKIVKQISFANPHARNFTSRYSRLEYIDGVDHHFTLLGDLWDFQESPENVHPQALEELIRAIDYVKNYSSEPIYEEYEIDDLYQLLFLEIYQMLLDNTVIKKCRHCKKYFVVHNLNVEYCDRIAEWEDKPCSEIGSKRAFQRKLDEDYPLKIYNRSYKTHYARVKKGKMTKSQFSSWGLEAREKLNDAREGTLSIIDFEQWLKI